MLVVGPFAGEMAMSGVNIGGPVVSTAARLFGLAFFLSGKWKKQSFLKVRYKKDLLCSHI